MIRFLADENFDNDIVRGLRKRIATLEIIRVQDTEWADSPDWELLAHAAQHGFILLTHDINTLRGYFYQRMQLSLPCRACA